MGARRNESKPAQSGGGNASERDNHGVMSAPARSYLRFAVMIATSAAGMFVLMYTNTYELGHVFWSEERFYMALLMAGWMGIVMMAFMWGMYQDTRINVGIVAGGLALAVIAVWLSRSQHFVEDEAYMEGMIPHHSIAILTSERADIDDLRVRQLADEIIRTQRREIAMMKWLLEDIEEEGKATTETEAQERPVPEFEVTE